MATSAPVTVDVYSEAISAPVTVTVSAITSATSAPVTVTVLRSATSAPVTVEVESATPGSTSTSSPITVTVVGHPELVASAGEYVSFTATANNGTLSSVAITGVTPAPTLTGSGASGTERSFRAPIVAASTTLTITVTDSAAGTNTITVTVLPAYDRVYWSGAKKRSYRIITTGAGTPSALPVANFDTNTTAGPAPLTVQFTDTSTGVPTSWLWTFSDGTTSTQRNPVKTFGVGTWSVTLTATNAFGSATVSRPSLISSTGPATPPSDPLIYGGGLYGDGVYGS